jgi:four helix bundle protein
VIGRSAEGDDELTTPQEELRHRTKEFAYRVIRLFRSLPRTTEAQVIGKQLLRAAPAWPRIIGPPGAPDRPRKFVSRIGIVVEEADESQFWLECLSDNRIVRAELLTELLKEADELIRIFSASQQTAKGTVTKD